MNDERRGSSPPTASSSAESKRATPRRSLRRPPTRHGCRHHIAEIASSLCPCRHDAHIHSSAIASDRLPSHRRQLPVPRCAQSRDRRQSQCTSDCCDRKCDGTARTLCSVSRPHTHKFARRRVRVRLHQCRSDRLVLAARIQHAL